MDAELRRNALHFAAQSGSAAAGADAGWFRRPRARARGGRPAPDARRPARARAQPTHARAAPRRRRSPRSSPPRAAARARSSARRRLPAPRERATFPTSEAPPSASLRSFRLIGGRATSARSALDARMRFPGRARAERARRSAPSRPRSRLGDARAVAADDARAAVDAAAAAPLWRRVGAPAARALSPRLTAALPARGRRAAPPFRAGDGAAARVLVGALALRHALGDVADALTASEPAA